jgi:hypothetical protein
MAAITKEIKDAENRVRQRMQFSRELIEESNRLLSEKQTMPFHFGEENSDAVKTEISKATGIPFSPESKPEEIVKTENTAESGQKLSPQRQTTLTEFEVIPDNEKVIAREGVQQPRKMHTGPRMFNFGFSFTPASPAAQTQKTKGK